MTWIQATSQQMSPTPRHWPFLRVFGEKGLRLEHKALEFSQKAEKRRARGVVWMDWSNCRAARSPGEAGSEMKEAQMSQWWTCHHSAALKRWEDNATHVRMRQLIKVHLSLGFWGFLFLILIVFNSYKNDSRYYILTQKSHKMIWQRTSG